MIIMNKFICLLGVMSFLLISCGGNIKDQDKERKKIYIVSHPDDVGKYGEGTYLNSNSEFTCPHCGMRESKYNILHDCKKTNVSSSSSPDDVYDEGYDEGYNQGLNDGRRGKGHGSNYDESSDYYNHYETQYEDGYESGYEDGYYAGKSQYEDEQEETDW